jgi:hypothetical protein
VNMARSLDRNHERVPGRRVYKSEGSSHRPKSWSGRQSRN